MRIAQHTWVGGSPCHVFIHKIVDNIIPEFIPDIENKMMDAMRYGNCPGIINGVERTAARFFFCSP